METYIIVGKNRDKFIAYFAGNAQKNCEGATKEEAIGKLILAQGELHDIKVENE